jgi:hypothetical protein
MTKLFSDPDAIADAIIADAGDAEHQIETPRQIRMVA